MKTNSTDIYTYFTKPNGKSELLYSAEGWMRMELTLETAGPVAFSTREAVIPVLSGKGVLLDPDGEPKKFTLSKGDRIFIGAESVNRVTVVIEPVPFLEQITLLIESGFGGLKGIMGAAFRGRKGVSEAAATRPVDVRDHKTADVRDQNPVVPNFWKGRK